ncbi:MAG: efflux RND transporter permease subunit [Bacteroidota bacterium]
MSLSSLSIQRPVLSIVMSILIVLFGIIGYTYLGIREYPSVEPPIITVTTSYPGANADVIESQITEPLEESINGIAGIRSLTSASREGRSTITVEFEIGVDLDNAANDVRDRVSRANRNLPQDVDPPVVAKADADASAIVQITMTSVKRDLLELSDIANNVIKERVQTIQGVSAVQIWGEKKYSMRLQLDPGKMAAYGVTPIDIRNALSRENIELPSGRIEGLSTELTVRTQSRLSTVPEFNNLIIRETGGVPVKFQDIGHAELGPENERTNAKRNGQDMIGVGVVPQPGSNHIEIVREFRKVMEQLKKELPADIAIEDGFDTTRFISESISEVEQTIFIAFGLVILVIFGFLRDWRTTLIPILAIPVSLIGAFFIMYIAGFSINVLTLLGIVLAIGLVVDDAIVVLENIYSKVERGMTPLRAAIDGSSEIFFAIISTTVTLASVFLPIVFLQGITGQLFREFGIVIAGSVIISAFVALTLTPMLSAKLLKRNAHHSWLYTKTEPFFIKMIDMYRSSLNIIMAKRYLAFVIIGLCIAVIYLCGSVLQSELAPVEDRSILRVNVTGPEGATYDFMNGYIDELVGFTTRMVPEKKSILSFTSPGFGAASSANTGMLRIVLTDPNERTRTQQQIFDDLSRGLRKYTDVRTIVSQEQTIGTSRGGLPVQYVIQAPNFEKLKNVLPVFLERAQQDPTFGVVDVNLKFNKPELVVSVNRSKARELGITASDISQTIQLALSGQRYGYFIMNGKQYQIIGQVERQNRNKTQDLKSLYVRTAAGDLIQLDNLITVEEKVNPPQLFRYNRYISATVSANLAPGKTIGDGIDAMDRISAGLLDESFSTALSGPSKDFRESSSSLLFIFILALVLVYLILAAQFESFRDPFTIMFTVPLALAGAVLSLWYFRETLNIFSEIGMIMLIGLVTKNGILIVEFANQKREQGLSVIDAVKEASAQRFRPILMTSLTAVLGTLPIALALGSGSSSRVSMGIVVVFGLSFATFLTLYVVPVIYTFLTSKKDKHSETSEIQTDQKELVEI